MKCNKCGHDKFYATQRCVVSVPVIVDENGSFMDNLTTDWDNYCYSANDPEGPYECVECHHEYDPSGPEYMSSNSVELIKEDI